MLDINIRGDQYRIVFKHLVPFETQCFIFSGEVKAAAGYASCSEADNFSKSVGRKLSLGRALKHLGLTKEERATVWVAYFEKSGPKSVLELFNARVAALEVAGRDAANREAASMLREDFSG